MKNLKNITCTVLCEVGEQVLIKVKKVPMGVKMPLYRMLKM